MAEADEVPPRTPGGSADREARARSQSQARITLVRHGEPDWSPEGGQSIDDPGLTPFGTAQARETARALEKEHFDAIYVSPYARSQQTARVLSRVLGIPAVTIDGLAEVGVAVAGLNQEAVDRYFVEGSRRPLEDHWDGWPGAETFHDFYERITAAITEILARHACRCYSEHDFTVWDLPEQKPSIAIVAHGGTNAVALTHLLDIRPVPWEWLRFESGLAAFSVLQARPIGPKGHVWSLQDFNRDDHLVAAGLR